MEIERITTLYFSATDNTQKIISAITESLDIENARKFNLTLPEVREGFTDIHFEDKELLIVATPVYTGEIPDFLIPALEKLSSDGQPAVSITVDGGVGRGIALEQLKYILEEGGFETIAAASFTGEHSFSKKGYEIAHGRPKEDDISEVKNLAREISDKIKSSKQLKDFEDIELNLKKGFRSKIQEIIPTPQYGIKKLINKPEVNEEKCISCQACADNCPKGAIDKDTLEIDERECIRCMACVKKCPSEARKIEYRYPGLVRTIFEFLKNDEPEEPTIIDTL